MDVQQVLYNIGYTQMRDLGKEFQMRPLYRDSDNYTALCVNKHTGNWFDFVTKRGGHLEELVQLTLRLPTVENAQEYLGSTCQFVRPTIEIVELKDVKKFKKELLFKLNKDHSYWLGRNISEKTINTFEGGTTFNGRMAYRYVFPIFNENDELVGFSGRRLTDNENFPKWKHLGGKSSWIYPLKWNVTDIVLSKEVILLESIGDMLALWEVGIRNTIVTFGVDISVKIVQFLLRIDTRRILIGFNNDNGNNFVGNQAAEHGRKQLLNFFDEKQVIVAIPEFKDFGVMKPEQITAWKKQYLQPAN